MVHSHFECGHAPQRDADHQRTGHLEFVQYGNRIVGEIAKGRIAIRCLALSVTTCVVADDAKFLQQLGQHIVPQRARGRQ